MLKTEGVQFAPGQKKKLEIERDRVAKFEKTHKGQGPTSSSSSSSSSSKGATPPSSPPSSSMRHFEIDDEETITEIEWYEIIKRTGFLNLSFFYI